MPESAKDDGEIDRHEAVRYECGHRCWDAGIGGAPDRCSRCESPVEERFTPSGGGVGQ